MAAEPLNMASPLATLTLAEPVREPIDRDCFRAVMSRMAATVSVVAASDGRERLGRTATSVLSLSATPPAVLVAIDLSATLCELIVRTGGFSLAMLAHDQERIGDAFAGKLGPIDRFGLGRWGRWSSGQPRLYGAATSLECELIGRIETQTHMLVAGGIVEADTSNGVEPLVWYQRDYHVPHPRPVPAPE